MASVLNNTVRSKTLTGEEALQWIKDNPGKGYYDNNTGGFIEPERSGIANFLLGVSKPFRTAAAAPAGILMDIATRARGEYGDYMKEPPVKLPFLTGTESTAVREDPYLEFAKGAAGTASYFLPGGAAAGTSGLRAIGSAAGRGLIAGGLGGFGYSSKGEELSGALKGAALGGLIGGGLQGIKEAPGMLQKTGRGMEQSGLNRLNKASQADEALLSSQKKYIQTLDEQIESAKRLSAGGDTAYLDEIMDQLNKGKIFDGDSILPIAEAKMKSLGWGPKQIAQAKTNLIQDMADSGFAVNSADDLANNFAEYVGKIYGPDKTAVLTSYGDELVQAPGVSKAFKELMRVTENPDKLTRYLDGELVNIFGKKVSITNVPKEMTVNQLMGVKSLVDDIGGGSVKLLTDTSTKVDTKILKGARNAARDVFTDTKSIKEVNDYLARASNAEKFRDIVYEAPIIAQKQAERVSSQIGGLGLKKGKEISRITEKGASSAEKTQKYLDSLAQKQQKAMIDLSQLQEKLSTQNQFTVGLSGVMPIHTTPVPLGGDIRTPLAGMQVGLGKALQGVPNISSKTSKALGIGQGAVPGIVGITSGGTRDTEDVLDRVSEGGTISEEEAMSLMGAAKAGGGYSYQDAVKEAYSIFPNAPESTILSTAKFLMDQNAGPELDLDTGTISQIEQAIALIDKYGVGVAGKLGTGAGKIGEFFGVAGPGTKYRSLISQVRTELIRYIAGTAQTPAEMKNLVDRLPQPTDEPQVVKSKLNVLLDDLYQGSNTQPVQQTQLLDQYTDY